MSPVPKEGIAPKFYEPWTGPFEVGKRVSDVTNELLDVAKNLKKIVHFDRLNKATVNPRPQLPDKSESDSQSFTDNSIVNVNVTAKLSKKRKSIASKAKSNNATASAPENSVAENLHHDNRVSKRAIKSQVSGRYSVTLYMIAILFTIALVLSTVGASPVLAIASSQTETTPILDGHTLWHPYERAILLSGYQFHIVSYKLLPPKTSAGKYLCGGSYNETEMSAPSWYIEWEHEIESLAKWSLKLS